MFSFMKFIQGLFSKIRDHKGLWFTSLGVLSATGIFVSMYIMFGLTKDVSHEVYLSTANTYNTNVKNVFKEKENYFNNLLITIKNEKSLSDALTNIDKLKIDTILNNYNKSYKREKVDIKVKFYLNTGNTKIYRDSVSSSIANKNQKFGFEIFPDGIYSILLEPVIKGNEVIGVFELKEKISFYREYFTKNNKIFVFLLKETMLNKLSKNIRENNYNEVIAELYVDTSVYNSIFYGSIRELGLDSFETFLDMKYSLDNLFFKTYRPITDINGDEIGLIILGETIEGKTFINIVQNMIKTITTVALGLVISILLFMF